MIQNPILPGFHPDPSIIRVKDDYYVVTSSFEWLPGLPLYHSKDLVHWRHVANLLKNKKQIDMTGEKPSRGVWAPALDYDENTGRFYLVYSNVHSQTKSFFDVDNFLMWTDDILGEWSDPIYLNSSGFDPSPFIDDDGSFWLVNKDRDFRPQNIDKRAIVLQRYDFDKKCLAGEPVVISRGVTERRFVEGAHLFKKDGFYYLIAAEGGTGYGHAVTLARSKTITGPYEPSPYGVVLTSQPKEFTATEQTPFMMPEQYNPGSELQKSGHGSLVETASGEWYMAHLCGRPVMPEMRCILGRETALQKMMWTEDGWLRMADGSCLAKSQVPAPRLPEHPFPPENPVCEFDSKTLPLYFCTPRNEITPEWAEICPEESCLLLRGQESLSSYYKVSLLARRLTSLQAEATTLLKYEPTHYHHLAGVTCYYDSESHFCLYKTFDEVKKQEVLAAYAFEHNEMRVIGEQIPVEKGAAVWLRMKVEGGNLLMLYSLDGENYRLFGEKQDLTVLSDEYSRCGCFTGTFVGVFAQDTHTKSKWARFDWFQYEDLPGKAR